MVRRIVQDYYSTTREFSSNARLFLVSTLLTWVGLSVAQVVFNLYLVAGGYGEDMVGGIVSMAGVGMAANVMLALLLFVVLGAVGIAIATTIAGWLQVTLLAATLHGRDEFALDRTFKRRFPAVVAASLIMGAVVFQNMGALRRAMGRRPAAD